MPIRNYFFALLGAFTLAMASLPASGSGEVLYSQMSGTPGGFLPSNQLAKGTPVECDESDVAKGRPQTCNAADDFTVPPGPTWYVEGVHVEGMGGADDRISWSVEAGQELPPALGEGEIHGGIYHAVPPAADSFDLPWGPSGGAALEPGHYWLGVSAGRVANWAWQTQTPVTGDEAAWLNPPCGGTAWKHLSECGLPSADLRFRIEGVPINREFSAFKLSNRSRRPDGGVVMLGTFPSSGELTVRKISGKATIEKCKCLVVEHGKSGFLAGIKIKPVGKTKAALKQGKKFKVKVAVTFKRAAYVGSHLIDVPSSTQIVTVVLKKS